MMSRVLLVLALVLAGVLGLGIYMRWFHVSSDSVAGTSSVTFSVDKEKIQEDEKKLADKVHNLGGSSKDKPSAP
jgi:predicted negative regulator of RcsB-dependent stress response